MAYTRKPGIGGQIRMTVEYRTGELGTLLLRRWWIAALGLVLGALAGLGALQFVAPTYTATATQLVKGIPGQTTGANYIAAQFAVARARSYPAFIYSSAVLDGVRADLGEEYTDARLRDQLSAANPTETPLINVRATGATPEEAKALADSAAKHLAQFITTIETIRDESPVEISTAVEAGLPVRPSAPSRTLFVGMGGAVGLAAGVLVIVTLAFTPKSTARRGR